MKKGLKYTNEQIDEVIQRNKKEYVDEINKNIFQSK